MAIEGGDQRIGALAAERNDEGGGELEVRRHAHFRHGDHHALEGRIVDLAALENLGKRVADQFADAQLALGRRAGRCGHFAMKAAASRARRA